MDFDAPSVAHPHSPLARSSPAREKPEIHLFGKFTPEQQPIRDHVWVSLKLWRTLYTVRHQYGFCRVKPHALTERAKRGSYLIGLNYKQPPRFAQSGVQT